LSERAGPSASLIRRRGHRPASRGECRPPAPGRVRARCSSSGYRTAGLGFDVHRWPRWQPQPVSMEGGGACRAFSWRAAGGSAPATVPGVIAGIGASLLGRAVVSSCHARSYREGQGQKDGGTGADHHSGPACCAVPWQHLQTADRSASLNRAVIDENPVAERAGSGRSLGDQVRISGSNSRGCASLRQAAASLEIHLGFARTSDTPRAAVRIWSC